MNSIRLGLYETIDKHFDEWLSYDNALKLYFITSDIEIYGKEKYKKSIYRAGSLSTNKLNDLLKEFHIVPKTNKEGLKRVYLEFIDAICKPDKKNISVQNDEDGEERNENFTITNEHKIVKEIELNEIAIQDEATIFEEKTKLLESLAQKANLSDVEIYALDFLKSERKEKHPLLNNFTPTGIIQIANRAAYKVYYLSRIDLHTK